MEQSLSDIAVNSIYRLCFKSTVAKQDREISGSDQQAVGSCFERMISAYKLVSPAVFRSFEFVPPAGEDEEGEEESSEESSEEDE